MTAKSTSGQASTQNPMAMELAATIGKFILENYFQFYCRQTLDDAEYVPTVRVIIEGLDKGMAQQKMNDKDRLLVRNDLRRFCRNSYIEIWVKHAVEAAQGEPVDQDDERESAEYYFDYIYEHGEHPR